MNKDKNFIAVSEEDKKKLEEFERNNNGRFDDSRVKMYLEMHKGDNKNG